MPESLLAILKLLFLLLLYLFFFRVLSAVWAEINPRNAAPVPAPTGGGRAAAHASGPAAAPAAGPAAGKGPSKVVIVEPVTAKGQSWSLGDEVTVGRAPGCGVPLTDDSTVSQLHARIFRKDGRLLVEDLGSTNGTFLNGKRVSAPVPLRVRDRLQIGATVLEVAR